MTDTVTLEDCLAAQTRIAGHVRETPVNASPSLSARHGGATVLLKMEQLQFTGSFKLRGATNAVLSLDDEARAKGIVGVSTGNHGRGLAYAARQARARCIICMSELVPQNKVEGIKAHGAEVRIVGRSQDDAQVEVDRLVARQTDQQYFQQGLQVRGIEQHVFQLLGLQVQVAVDGDSFRQAALTQLGTGHRGGRPLDPHRNARVGHRLSPG